MTLKLTQGHRQWHYSIDDIAFLLMFKYSGNFCIGSAQSEQDALKAAKRQIEELQRVRETHMKQLQFLISARTELEKHIEEMLADYNLVKNGTNVVSELYEKSDE